MCHVPLENHIAKQPEKNCYFYGSEKKGEVSYDLWKHEGKCFLRDTSHSDENKALVICRSLRGQAGNRILHLPDSATTDDITNTLDSICESATPKENFLGRGGLVR